MNMFDPARERTATDYPQLLRSIDAVPIMYVDVIAPDTVELSAWVRTRDGSGHVCRSCAIEVEKLGAFMSAYIADPELVLTNHFDWTAHATPTRSRDPNTAQPTSKPRGGLSGGSATAIEIPEDLL